jgi:hypothetical protein
MTTENRNDIVYVLTNPAMPNLTKVGKTTQGDVETRLSQLYTSGVPVPFECAYACQVKDCTEVESALHLAFGNTRVNPKREFFKIEPERVIAVLKLLAVKDVTPQVEKELTEGLDNTDKESREDLERSRRPNMNFGQMKIPVGAVLLYKDGEVQVTVADEKHVNYKDRVCSLTAATKEIMGLDYSVQPAPHWTYEGKTLKKIYEDTYSDDEE